jgi:RNA polymerase primary sigma factor
MKSLALASQPPSEPESKAPAAAEVAERGAPLSRVRPRSTGAGSVDRDTFDLYYADLAGRRPLTREGEVALGQRIEAGEQAIIDAWLRCPVALRELVLTAGDVRVGAIHIHDLLVEPDPNDATSATARCAELTALLDGICALAVAPEGPVRTAGRAELVAALAALPLDTTFRDRMERCLRETAAAAPPGERAAIEATLSAIARARRAIARAKGELVEANLRLAVAIARQFQRFDVPLGDLAQEGNLGLIRAADRFDYRRGHRFGTYASWWIKQAIRRAILRQGRGLRMPAHLAEARSRVARTRRDFIGLHGREPTPEEIAEQSGVPFERVRVLTELAMEPLSLDAPVGEDGDSSFGDLLAGSTPAADEALSKRRLVEQTLDLLAGLTPREREILERRHGLYDREDETLEEIGRSCSLTRERIRQIEAQALEKLRMRSRKLKLGSSFEG